MKAIRLLLAVACIAMTTACATNPVTGKQELALVPEAQELAIGNEQYLPSQQSQGGLYTVDPAVGEYVSEIGQKIAAVSDRSLPYEFVVLNDSTPNAWALPGGKIAINRGLLTQLGSEAELAAVLGHEIVHAAARHGAQAMQRGLVLQGVVLATAVAAKDNDYTNTIVGGAQLGAQLINQRYGREAELEADLYGMQYMARAGYDPAAAVSLQETFVELSGGGQTNWLAGLFASHPPSAERVEANRQTLATLDTDGITGAEEYEKALARLFQTKPAYDAFDQASGMLAQGETDDALTFVNRALSIESEEPRFYGLKGQILLAKDEYDLAKAEFDKALLMDDGYYEYYLGRGLALAELEQPEAAREDLERSNQLLPTAVANARLGDLALSAGQVSVAKSYFETAMAGQGEVAEDAGIQFTRIDLAQNPMKYMRANAFLSPTRELRCQIGNGTQFPVRNAKIEFTIIKNGEPITTEGFINGTIPPYFLGEITSGMTFSEEDELSAPKARIVSLQVLN